MGSAWLQKLVLRLSLMGAFSLATPLFAADEQPAPPTDSAAPTNSGLDMNMSLDNLMKQDVVVPGMSTVVNSVNRQESTIGKTPGAVFVITQDMIKRSGARCIPEALRMAPGIEVAKIDSHSWAISARGHLTRFSNKLLIQIDRRAIYTPTFAGTFWDMQAQDVVLADVDRIEVIRGPGTVMWGSNAVNGVINIITKSSKDTQGALVQAGGGTYEKDFTTARYGGQLSEDLTYRVHGQQFDRNRGFSDFDVDDAWRQKSFGFRTDYTPTPDDTLTVQGDMYETNAGALVYESITTFPYVALIPDTTRAPGGNVLTRYSHKIDDDTSYQLQSYYDHYERKWLDFQEARDTYDIDLQYQFKAGDRHQLITGANYRNSSDRTIGTPFFYLLKPNFTVEWTSVFLQDTMTIEEDFCYFTLGGRLEYQTYGNLKAQPTARLLFTPTNRQSLWLAFSRAARNPTRYGTGFVGLGVFTPGVPEAFTLFGNPNLKPEDLNAYEIGYREAPSDYFSYDIAAFFNDYNNVESFAYGAPFFDGTFLNFPVFDGNYTQFQTYGLELSSTLKLTDRWRVMSNYTLLYTHDKTNGDPSTSDPKNFAYLRSSWDLNDKVQFDLTGRYVDRLTASGYSTAIPKYIEMDARLGWQVTKTLEASFVGQNLLDSHHPEFYDILGTDISTQVRRGWYGMLTWVY